MHWVWATDAHSRQRIPVNLAAIPTMTKVAGQDGARTILFLGGLAIDAAGKHHYAQTHVLETPEELLALPAVLPPSIPSPQPKSKAKGRSE